MNLSVRNLKKNRVTFDWVTAVSPVSYLVWT